MNFTRTQIEPDLQCKLELLGRLGVDCGYQGTELHRHPFFEVFYISVGSFDTYFQQSSERVSKGDIFIISPDVLHRFVSTDGGEMLYAGISVTHGMKTQYPLFFRPLNADISETMERISYSTSKKGSQVLRDSLGELMPKLSALIISLIPKEVLRTEDTLSEKIKSYLRHHYNENVTVGDIAGALYMNSHYLGEYFKKCNGISVKDYLLTLRMQKAFALLKEGNMTVSQIAENVGFDTVQYFSTKFKAYYGISPAKYMEKLKGNGE